MLSVPFCGVPNTSLSSNAFESLVPNAKPVPIPVQDLDSVPVAIDEQKQMPRQRILVEDPLRKPHQPVETEVHAGGRQQRKTRSSEKFVTTWGAFPRLR